MEHLLSTFPNSIVIGDMNLNLLTTNNDINKYLETAHSNGYVFLNKIHENFATRLSSNPSIIDHVLTDMLNLQYDLALDDVSISDHKLIALSFNKVIVDSPTVLTKTVLDYQKLINEPELESVKLSNTVDQFVQGLEKIVKNHTRAITIKTKKTDMPWMNPSIRSLINRREKFFSLKNKNQENVHVKNMYFKYKSIVVKEIKKAKKKYYGDIMESSIGKPKVLWQNLKTYIFNKNVKTKPLQIILKHNDKIIESKQEVANVFNSYFIDIVSQNPFPLNQNVNRITSVNYNIPHKFELFQTNEIEILNVIDRLKSNVATGFDSISTKVIKILKISLCGTITRLTNNILDSGEFPNLLKIASVCPIFKAGNVQNTENYRPISVLSSLSKVVERIISNRLSNFLEKNDIISKNQFGFSPNSNTTAACMELTNFISIHVDKKQMVSCIFLDLKRAFDSVNHRILIKKLEQMEFTEKQLNLFKTYLTERKQFVSIDGEKSSLQTVKSGVPQGSILGPILFRIFINDVTSIDLDGHLILYADDAALLYHNKNADTLFDQMQNDLEKIQRWLEENQLLLNVSKTKYMIFKQNSSHGTNLRDLKYGSLTLGRVDEFTYLGLVLNSQLKWNSHIDKIKKSITPYMFAIRKAKNVLPQRVLVLMYNSYIMSHINYLNPIWSGGSEYKMNELYVLQKKSIKSILCLPMRYPSNMLFNSTNKFMSLETICKRELLILIFKIVNNLIKHNIDLSRIGETHSYNTRRTSQYRVNSFLSNARDINVLYRGLIEFNKLPSLLRKESSLYRFKRGILDFV